MASNGKKKTTMAKINREHRLRERRMDKQARKEARKREAAWQQDGVGAATTDDAGTAAVEVGLDGAPTPAPPEA